MSSPSSSAPSAAKVRIRMRYFASLREALGEGEALTAPAQSTVASVRALLQSRSTAHAEVLSPSRAVRAALNQRMCQDQDTVQDGDELAFFPPVTGG